jgi:glycosyltransferase involved in cell wall biosynthesis
MRIGLIAPPWLPVPPPLYGGTEAVVDRLARGLVRAGHDVLLFTTGDSTCDVPKRWFWGRAQPRHIGQSVVEMRHLVHAYAAMEDRDVIHDHTLLGPVYAARRSFPPTVTTNHGPFEGDLGDIYRVIAPDVPVIAISHAQAASAGSIPIARVIHHGLDVDQFTPGIGEGGYVAFLGRMSPDKGPREAALAARRADVPLKMAAKMGEPAEQAYFDEHVRPLLGDGVEYIGEIGDGEKEVLLGGAVALLNPIQWQEPFGLVMVEALACGTPVITRPLGAAPEIVQDGVTGTLCLTLDDLVEGIRSAHRLDRAACRQSVVTHFTTHRVVAEHVELYDQVISREKASTTRRRASRPPR